MEQFEDLMSDCKTPKQETGEKVLIVEVNEVDRKSDQKTASAGTRLNAKQPIGSEVKSTDVNTLLSLSDLIHVSIDLQNDVNLHFYVEVFILQPKPYV